MAERERRQGQGNYDGAYTKMHRVVPLIPRKRVHAQFQCNNTAKRRGKG